MFLVFEYTLRPEAVNNDYILLAYVHPFNVTDMEISNVQLEQTLKKNDPAVYFHKEVLINSMEGNAMHLITITRDENWQKMESDPETERDTISEATKLIEVEVETNIESEDQETKAEGETVEIEQKKVYDFEEPDHLYPNKEEKRPIRFVGKPVIFLSARVHCGETPASFFLQGIYDFLMSHKAI